VTTNSLQQPGNPNVEQLDLYINRRIAAATSDAEVDEWLRVKLNLKRQLAATRSDADTVARGMLTTLVGATNAA